MHLKQIGQRRLARIKGRARAASDGALAPKSFTYARSKPLLGADSEPTARSSGETERRRSNRVTTSSQVLVRRIGGFNFNVALKDISNGGCRVEMLEPSEVGDPVITRLPQLEPLGSRVCWAEGTTTGVQFLTTIHPAVFEMLLSRLSSPQRAEPVPLD